MRVDDVALASLSGEFAAREPGDPWFHVRTSGYATTDATVSPLAAGGLRIVPRHAHPGTGQPAFSISLAPESRNGGIPAANDHAKWLAYMRGSGSSRVPGFEAAPGTELAATARLTGRTFGTELHPFGAAVRDPHADARLAAFAMTSIDLESWMVFDFLFTNRQAYAVYERLPFGRTEAHTYAAFTYAIPVGPRSEDDRHEATIAYDRAGGVVRWILDGSEVCRIDRIGCHLPSRANVLIDLGGAEQQVAPRQLTFGMGLFTLLDGAVGEGPGLVRLSDRTPYYSPAARERPLSFVDEHSHGTSRLFGQGAEMSVLAYDVRIRRLVSGAPPAAAARA